MPRKTKKEKIIALYRHKYKLLKQKANLDSGTKKTRQKKAISPLSKNQSRLTKPLVNNNRGLSYQDQIPETPTEPLTNNKLERNTNIKLFFFKDLRKSLILTTFIIGIEIFLYSVNIGYIKIPKWLSGVLIH